MPSQKEEERKVSEFQPMGSSQIQTPNEEPILILDIKLLRNQPEKIIVMENDDPEELVARFSSKHRKCSPNKF